MTLEAPRHPRSLYNDLLDAALSKRKRTHGIPSIGEALADLEQYRCQMIRSSESLEGRGWATGAVAEQVAYDVALVRCAQCLDIDCDPGGFGWPQDERQRLEHLLASR